MESQWISLVVQTGAIGILAYHFLVGLPAILERIAKEQQAERLFWAAENTKDREAVAESLKEIVLKLERLLVLHYVVGHSIRKNDPPRIDVD